ncbi:MAG TPA: hypothetical protein VFW66_08075 [Gemmatimonadales bacterium]|nr:hypothetical protein [Gemmatimonadales bacterium]
MSELGTHLSMEQLLALREAGVEPGDHAARAHLESCPACDDELERLHQRAARLKALPALRPTRDRWPLVRARLERERRERRMRRAGIGGLVGLAAAASIAVGVTLRPDLTTRAGLAASAAGAAVTEPEPARGATAALSEAMARSRALEQAIGSFDPDSRVLDGRTARVAEDLEDRIAAVDRQLEAADLLGQAAGGRAPELDRLRLWQERVGLLDALVDVHLTNASNVGL